MKRVLEDGPRNYGIEQDFWTVKALKVVLLKRGVEYRKSRLYELVHELGYELVTPRPTNVKAEREKWDDFKKSEGVGRRSGVLLRRVQGRNQHTGEEDPGDTRE
ncbi:hypothetical protein DFR87_09510 [Metallosphaera hakonensis JCM 8857 = DSM 7519]|uniref:Winged helix-turn helix domain-containing protein n=1 Tax=Metallosphaera hakonensis JCM 8857 = DSM 7519 TaxID=1293036 RepID=A0A2U9IV52_9CREN|nr:hypothetical protein DFR87_09510 [Metallosphaera hakonensis JCM 8857 = DSM 7519]